MAQAQDQDQEAESFRHRHGPMIGGVVVLLVFGVAAYFAVGGLKGSKAPEPPKVQEISLVQPPPPPPPPPKLEEPPPPEQVMEEPPPEPEPIAEDAPAEEAMPGDELGLDADGTAGSDGFGLRGKKGGRGLIGGGDRNRWYAGQMQRTLQRDLLSLLSGDEELRDKMYSIVINIWVADDGHIKRVDLVESTGNGEADAHLHRILSGLRMSDSPPEDMPQPVKLRIVTR